MVILNTDLALEKAKATILLFCSMLNERQRRLYAGLEYLKLGHGGDAHIASFLGMHPHTVARGRQKPMSGELTHDRVRAKGAVAWYRKKTPEIIEAIAAIMEYETAGDPVSGCK